MIQPLNPLASFRSEPQPSKTSPLIVLRTIDKKKVGKGEWVDREVVV